MPGTVGPVNIPIKSTFDPSGVMAAKAGLKDLANAQGGAGGGGSGGGGTAGGPPGDRLGMKSAILTMANQLGVGGISSGMMAGGIAAGVVATGVAVYALTQRIASSAIATRDQARALGVSTQYYSGLAAAARKAGTDVGAVTNALTGLHGMASSALGGDIGSSILLQSMGVTREDLASGDTTRIARNVLKSGAGAAVLGSSTAADALRNANGESGWNVPTAGETQAAAALKIGFEGLGTKLGAGLHNMLHGDAQWSWREGLHAGHGAEQREAEAAKKEVADQKAAADKIKLDKAAAIVSALLNPAEMAAQQHAAAGGLFNVTNDRGENIFGADAARFTGLRHAQIEQERLSAEAPLRRPEDIMHGQLAINQERWENGGFANEKQFNEAQINTRQAADTALAPVRSKFENLTAQMQRGTERWNNSGDWNEHEGVARRMGLQVQDYADSMTRAGSLAGAADMNTVGGYSQLVGAQEQMRQSTDSRAMAEMLIQQLPKAIADAIRNERGFEFRRPMGPMN